MAKKQVNFKLPQDLIEALDAKALQENTNRTELVIQGIRQILGLSEAQCDRVDRSVYTRIEELENRVSQLGEQRIDEGIYDSLHTLTEQVQNLSDRLARIQGQKESTTKIEHHNLPEVITVGAQPTILTLTELAKRLGIDRSNLAKARKTKTAIELAVYTKGRDPQGIAWQFNEGEKAFKPV